MKDTLGGNCETLMLCCVSSSEKSIQDTVNCLKYGSMVRNIINKPVINEVSRFSWQSEFLHNIHVFYKKTSFLRVPQFS